LDSRVTHARVLLRAAFTSVPFELGFVLVRVRFLKKNKIPLCLLLLHMVSKAAIFFLADIFLKTNSKPMPML
jgi:hypothetical protein